MNFVNHAEPAHCVRRGGPLWVTVMGIHAALILATSIARGDPPIQPTLPPFYAFDASSPSVDDGTVGSSDLLLPGPDAPNVCIPGAAIGMGLLGDAIDALSGPNVGVDGNQSIALLFSVDRATEGVVLPDQELEAEGVPYNAADQAAKGQAAGDQFMGLTLYTRSGGPLPGSGGRAVDNNTLLRNNYDEGGVDFSAKPQTSAAETATRADRALQDNVNSTTGTSIPATGCDTGPVYFSASADSPSLAFLPGGVPSGANLYFNADPAGGVQQSVLFASFVDLGLVLGDDINGVIVFDIDGNGAFNGLDQVIFTLVSGSPSLATIGQPGEVASAADVFSVDASGVPNVFAPAAGLGLGGPLDDIDALDFLPCTDAIACALLHGIRQPAGIPSVSTWGMIVMTLLTLLAGTVVLMRRQKGSRPGSVTA